MKRCGLFSVVFICSVFTTEVCVFGATAKCEVSGELKKWHDVTLTFTGPDTSEDAQPNPFRDYRLTVTFAKGQKRYVVGGYYAADGDAAQTSAKAGNKWRVHFVPDEAGQWSYTASFRTGSDVAIARNSQAGSAAAFDGATGTLEIIPSDKTGRDHRAKGLLRYVGKRYLQFAGSGEYFLKGGADSPENFLGYADFDDTFDSGELKRKGEAAGAEFIHHYRPHGKDWRPGDPTWKDGKGKGMIGALNYLLYFGYKWAHNDLNCEDWRSRDHLWDLTRYALDFFGEHLPFTQMAHHDELTALPDDYCFARPGEIYAVYYPGGSITSLDLGDNSATFTVQWYNPRTGGPLKTGVMPAITGPGSPVIGSPPNSTDKDWVALIKLK